VDQAERSPARIADGVVLCHGQERRPRHQGATIGTITDFHGKVIEEIRATFDGEILYVIGTPPISKGEPVAMIGSS
jgi:hypothetical protein